jgi:hypothetical protein
MGDRYGYHWSGAFERHGYRDVDVIDDAVSIKIGESKV